MRPHPSELGLGLHDGYKSSAVGGHPKEGPRSGYESSAKRADSGHPKKGEHAGYQSSRGPSSSRHTIFNAVNATIQRLRSRRSDEVSLPTFVTLSTSAAALPGLTVGAAAYLVAEFPPNPLLGAAEATGLAIGAFLSGYALSRMTKVTRR